MRLAYLPLEPYQARYTELLAYWTLQAWGDQCDLRTISGVPLTADAQIHTGRVLDAAGRSYWALRQTAQLLALLHDGYAPDAIYLDDLFHPGLEALGYLFAQWDRPAPRLYARNWAQTVDQYDFTAPMQVWLRPYEQMADALCTCTFVAHPEHAALCEVAGLRRPSVVGLPYDVAAVRAFLTTPPSPYYERPPSLLWSARWDTEKQPELFMDLAEHFQGAVPCHVASGSPTLRSNDAALVARAHELATRGLLTLHLGLDKAAYYALVAQCRVHVLASLQDWIAFSLLDASACGTPSVVPAWRGFLGVYDPESPHYWQPWSFASLVNTVSNFLRGDPSGLLEVATPAAYHSGTFQRVFAIMAADGSPVEAHVPHR